MCGFLSRIGCSATSLTSALRLCSDACHEHEYVPLIFKPSSHGDDKPVLCQGQDKIKGFFP